MIEVRELVKRFGGRTAVDRLSFTVRPGTVTGFLGPNGAGKSTTIRMIMGLDAPASGRALVAGREYRRLREPMRTVGALLDARAAHPGRSAHDHLLWQAHGNGIGRARVREVLDLVGLGGAASGRRVGGFSLGMAQRLGIAGALLGDPEVLILDEPVNGLDTEGIRWVRGLLRGLADEGRTVLLSSHLMSEMEQTADRLVVIGGGRLLADTTVRAFIDRHARDAAVVASPDGPRLRAALEAARGRVRPRPDGGWHVAGLAAPEVGAIAARAGAELHELRPERSSLEEVYLGLTEAEYRGTGRGEEATAR
ncbi:ATP-binding cassette domain-containing protein [Actinomadura rifamycini]|uniref:ATP-binding cassette domain-containing protein n=1 Tax=Actinomadura rifamycini TaxID=31962 RepID=UPI00040DCBA8|nr:ATP-binding cassette domain-containing protein [Actinomadura rifamycini]